MPTQIDKSMYLKFWNQINTAKQIYLGTEQIVQWVKALVDYEEDKRKKESKKNMARDMDGGNRKEAKDKNNGKLNNAASNQSQGENKNKSKTDHNKMPAQNTQSQFISSPLHTSKQHLLQQESQKPSPQLILSYLQKYSLTEQYKLFPKPSSLQEQSPQLQGKTHIEKPKLQKKDTMIKSVTLKKQKAQQKKQNRKKQKQQEEITISFEEGIYFYFWLVTTLEKDRKELFLDKIRKAQMQQIQSSQPTITSKILPVQSQNLVPSKMYFQLTDRQTSYLCEQSFLSLQQHKPKLHILFKHYSRQSHHSNKSPYTFDEMTILEQLMNLHQWMLFCKQWNILNAKSMNQGWEKGKITREFLMEVYYRNSYFRKQMGFEMFRKALVNVAGRMFQEVDIYKTRPIDLLLNFMEIKNQHKFILKIEQKNIKFTQGEILSCFKQKNRDVEVKMNLIKVQGNQTQRKLTLIKTKPKRLSMDLTNKKVSTDSRGFQLKEENEAQKGQKWEIQRRNSENNLLLHSKNAFIEHTDNLTRFSSTSNLNLSKLNSQRSSNLKPSIPSQLSIKLPRIQNNKYFTPITTNNHLNKFKEYIETQVPESSSVLRSKITGYHKIHSLQKSNEDEKLSEKNRIDHEKMNKMIGSKLGKMFDEDSKSKGSMKNSSVLVRKQANMVSQNIDKINDSQEFKLGSSKNATMGIQTLQRTTKQSISNNKLLNPQSLNYKKQVDSSVSPPKQSQKKPLPPTKSAQQPKQLSLSEMRIIEDTQDKLLDQHLSMQKQYFSKQSLGKIG